MNFYDRIKHETEQKYYAENYSNDGQRFIAWYLRNIYGLTEYEAKDCITDGAGDNQIDAVYVDHNNQAVYIIQGKFLQKGKIDTKQLEEIFGAWIQLQNPVTLQENANEKLISKINEISSAIDDEYDLFFELITTSELSKSAKKSLESFTQKMINDETLSAELVIVDENVLEARYNSALNLCGPVIDCVLNLENGRYIDITANETRTVIAVVSLNECLNIPGIQDGSLFRKNVRQSLGKRVKVNREISETLKKNPGEFLFLNNGITAICKSIEIEDNVMSIKDISVVNGCQSLTAIYNCSAAVRDSNCSYVVFRFYVIDDDERAESISRATNSQNAVKARDLMSNHKDILRLKKSYEHAYTDGQLITKRGEKESADKNRLHVIELSTLGKILISWYLQRPTEVRMESSIFTDHFKKIFHRDYTPEKIQALNEIFKAVFERWNPDNNDPLELSAAVFSQKAYVPYIHLFAVTVLLSELNKIHDDDLIPAPDIALKLMKDSGTLDDVIDIAGSCVNSAFESAIEEAKENGKVFSPHNWPKTMTSLKNVRDTIKNRLRPLSPEEKKYISELREKLKMSKRDFESRTAD